MKLSAESALFVGDTHADAGWLKFVVLPTAVMMGITTIIQVGDFGYWPDSRKFLNFVKTAREKFGVDVWFIDGNHEHFTTLNRNVRAAMSRRESYDCPTIRPISAIVFSLIGRGTMQRMSTAIVLNVGSELVARSIRLRQMQLCEIRETNPVSGSF
jgi:hypothetical protein